MVKNVLIAALMVVTAAGTAFAAHPLITDDTGTQGKGKFQLEYNGETSWDKETVKGVETKVSASQMAAAFTAGMTDTIDVVIGAPWLWNRVKEDGVVTSDENGVGDTTLEVKWRFFQYKGFSMAVKPGLILPTGNEDRSLGNGKLSYKGTLIATQEVEPFAFHFNASYTRNEFRLHAGQEDSNRHDIYHVSLATVYGVLKDLKVVTNIGFESNTDMRSRTWPAFLIGGLIYSPTEDFDLDMGVKGGLNKAETDLTLMAGVTVRF